MAVSQTLTRQPLRAPHLEIHWIFVARTRTSPIVQARGSQTHRCQGAKRSPNITTMLLSSVVICSSAGENLPVDDLEPISVAAPNGRLIPQAQVAGLETAWKLAALRHRYSHRVVTALSRLMGVYLQGYIGETGARNQGHGPSPGRRDWLWERRGGL